MSNNDELNKARAEVSRLEHEAKKISFTTDHADILANTRKAVDTFDIMLDVYRKNSCGNGGGEYVSGTIEALKARLGKLEADAAAQTIDLPLPTLKANDPKRDEAMMNYAKFVAEKSTTAAFPEADVSISPDDQAAPLNVEITASYPNDRDITITRDAGPESIESLKAERDEFRGMYYKVKARNKRFKKVASEWQSKADQVARERDDLQRRVDQITAYDEGVIAGKVEERVAYRLARKVEEGKA